MSKSDFFYYNTFTYYNTPQGQTPKLQKKEDKALNTATYTDNINPFAPELPVTARADPGPFYPLWCHQF